MARGTQKLNDLQNILESRNILSQLEDVDGQAGSFQEISDAFQGNAASTAVQGSINFGLRCFTTICSVDDFRHRMPRTADERDQLVGRLANGRGNPKASARLEHAIRLCQGLRLILQATEHAVEVHSIERLEPESRQILCATNMELDTGVGMSSR